MVKSPGASHDWRWLCRLRRIFLPLALFLSFHVASSEEGADNKKFFYLYDPNAGPIKELGPTYEGDTDRPDLIYDDQRVRLIECEYKWD